ncbi:MAG: UDP-N-acetylglucosamine 2-epimerase (non-hydrolyzing) [Candidatus Acidulodesulfobacterium ferriphilum]|uniref:UDP-N-acetylglucosamine 2-epimerase (non-hydrolyzing) n=1 Tax=Candidatus Acidulodesulfobacterium ferriphilum TaxID=2597223 RepID=A0A519BBZ5_9DELT|nr:MAG: UDP-N-acetylglucosamine 2-epimerase (non-hydrolyzing) [Candidatus Acidulodesulfobacterium ferriphilum]
MPTKLLFILGTRPEAIKLAPLILKSKEDDCFDVKVCITGQHKQMLEQVINFFNIKIDHDFELMKPNQSLFNISADILKAIEPLIENEKPDFIIVQGDTTTAFIGAIAGFYKKIRVIHLEAGLRSHDKYSPFPEEMNRILISQIANYHFAPTKKASDNLFDEGIKDNVYIVGNTAIDALLLGLDLIREKGDKIYKEFFNFLDFSKKIILVTGHRRESFGKGIENICEALKEIAIQRKDIQIVYPVHLNPNVSGPVYDALKNVAGVFLMEPLEYQYLIWLMNKSFLVLTDSGGIQEEAPFLGKPVIVMRDSTERIEAVEAGVSVLSGAHKDIIVEETVDLLDNKLRYRKMGRQVNIYGDGKSSEKIISILKEKHNCILEKSFLKPQHVSLIQRF